MRDLRFVRMEIREIRLPFRFSFGHALAERRENRTLIVSLALSTGETGYGEALPRPYLTGETADTAWEDLRRWAPRLGPMRLPAEPCRSRPMEPLWEALRPLYLEADAARKTAAYAGLDIAAADAYARALGLPGCRMLEPDPPGQEGARGAASPAACGAWRAPVPLTGPLGYDSPRKTWWLGRALRLAGFRDFKIKLGREDDEARLAAARRAIGAWPLRGDANGAWASAAALADGARLARRYGLGSVEQPTLAGGGLVAAAAALGVPVMADESLATREDAQGILGAFAGYAGAVIWNLRLAKVGGFSGFRELLALARKNGVTAQLGVLVGETSLLASAGRACLALGPFCHVEHGFAPLLLRADPFKRGPSGWRGIGRGLSAKKGLSISLSQKTLDSLTVRAVNVDLN